jgi:hypothetical protein
MSLLGLYPSNRELAAMIKEIDTDGNGEVDFEEFLQVRLPSRLVSQAARIRPLRSKGGRLYIPTSIVQVW